MTKLRLEKTTSWQLEDEKGGYCLEPNTLLATDVGHKPISKIESGDFVLSDDGYTEVLNIIRRPYKGDLVAVSGKGLPEFHVTPEHPLLTTKGWTPTGDVRHNRRVCSPLITEQRIDDRLLHGFDFNPQLGEFLGWYIAEGYLSNCFWQVGISLGRHESEIAEKLMSTLKDFYVKTWIKNNNGHPTVEFKSKKLVLALDHWVGHGAATKRLCNCLMHGPRDFQEALLRAWTQGDGWQAHEGIYNVDSTSLSLIQTGQLLAQRLGHPALISKRREAGKTNQGWNAKDMWALRWMKRPGKQGRFTAEGRQMRELSALYWTRIPYCGEVYNLTTANHAFDVYGLLTHNCVTTYNRDDSELIKPIAEGIPNLVCLPKSSEKKQPKGIYITVKGYPQIEVYDSRLAKKVKAIRSRLRGEP